MAQARKKRPLLDSLLLGVLIGFINFKNDLEAICRRQWMDPLSAWIPTGLGREDPSPPPHTRLGPHCTVIGTKIKTAIYTPKSWELLLMALAKLNRRCLKKMLVVKGWGLQKYQEMWENIHLSLQHHGQYPLGHLRFGPRGCGMWVGKPVAMLVPLLPRTNQFSPDSVFIMVPLFPELMPRRSRIYTPAYLF